MSVYKGDVLIAGGGLNAGTVSAGTTVSGVNDTVVEYWVASDGLTWYRKWASGWKECGGKTNTSSSNYKYVNLPITFSDTSYTAIGSFADNSGYPLQYTRVQSVNGIDMQCAGSGTKYMFYYCCGY